MDHRPARRAFVLVIDACGVGALPDAADYGDEGTNTLAHVAEAVGGLELPTLQALGLGSIIPAARRARRARTRRSTAACTRWARARTRSAGHWELMGVVLERALPTYPEGFPPAGDRASACRRSGHEVICNRPDNGHRGDRGVRRRAPAQRRADPLHLPGLGAAAGRARRAGARAEELYRACAAARAR